MLAPILPKLAVLIATQYTNAPTLLFHCSSLISQAPSNFLETLLPHYLPVLVASCSRTQLEAIAKTLEQTVAALIIHNSADVLEKVFLLETMAQTEASLTMINEYLSAAAPKRRRGEKEKESSALASMVKSCIVPLLGKLVFKLGDLEMDRKNVVSSYVQHFHYQRLKGNRCSMLLKRWSDIVQRSRATKLRRQDGPRTSLNFIYLGSSPISVVYCKMIKGRSLWW